ncbi:hypothetical protein [Proteiniphilum propionicum]|uniref:hypothetical protein n=1 Tax=Proteiniphilum propionicum TaxID=2829812 RepID=UPI001EEB1796|nr:hypothetical protein [Proteiniphilum propionicum]ULB35439.1 hypothetical protein KDN43_05225 [Proteiniphilum propionicum]
MVTKEHIYRRVTDVTSVTNFVTILNLGAQQDQSQRLDVEVLFSFLQVVFGTKRARGWGWRFILHCFEVCSERIESGWE